VRLNGEGYKKYENNVAQLAHKKKVIGTKGVRNRILVCHLAHKHRELAHKPEVSLRQAQARGGRKDQYTLLVHVTKLRFRHVQTEKYLKKILAK